jgi:hypothetical protein
VNRERLRELLPTASARADLSAVPVDALADLVLDRDEPWWRRRPCAEALAGRVPDERAGALLDCVRDDEVTTEIRVALLDVLSEPDRPHTGELLSWLRSQDGTTRYGLDVAVLRARASVGDLSVVRPLTALAADPWRHRHTAGKQSLDELIDARGLPAVLAELGADSIRTLATAGEAERLLGVRLEDRAGADVTASLGDDSPTVARTAYELLCFAADVDDTLRALVERRGPGHLWALAALRERGHPVRATWESLGPPRIELPTVPDDVRLAILREYLPHAHHADPRWLLEAACTDLPEADEQALLRRAVRALAGLAPQPPVSAGDLHQQSEGTYHVIDTDDGRVTVSTLGPFFRAENDRAVEAMEAADFRHVDDALSSVRFVGLDVYYFGNRISLPVDELLFHWQD